MINFKNWLEEGGAISPNLNPNSPNNPRIPSSQADGKRNNSHNVQKR